MPISSRLRMTRMAISPLLATRTLVNTGAKGTGAGATREMALMRSGCGTGLGANGVDPLVALVADYPVLLSAGGGHGDRPRGERKHAEELRPHLAHVGDVRQRNLGGSPLHVELMRLEDQAPVRQVDVA